MTLAELHKVFEFLQDAETVRIAKEYRLEKNTDRKELFNVFRLASDLYYRENFHSDIISAFLDPNGTHGEDGTFLFRFIDLLNANGFQISKSNYQQALVEREYHRIDILVRSESTHHCLIIENKINNAGDMQRQLPRYYDCMTDEGYEIDAIVYIPLDQNKEPDRTGWTEEDYQHIQPRLITLPAYTKDGKPNLVSGWVNNCITATKHIDCISVLSQYGDLITTLNRENMNSVILEQFYEKLKENSNMESALSIKEMLEAMPVYMADRLIVRYKANDLYNRVWKYKPFIFVLDFTVNKMRFAIDILTSKDGYNISFFSRNNDIITIIPQDSELNALKNFDFIDGRYRFSNFSFWQEGEVINWIDSIRTEIEEFIKVHYKSVTLQHENNPAE